MDNVNHPAHYVDGGIETIDFIRAKLEGIAFIGYCLGNVLKYISRWNKKDDPIENLEKAQVYLGWAIDELRKGKEKCTKTTVKKK